MTETDYLGLKLYEDSDDGDLRVMNENMQIIEGVIGEDMDTIKKTTTGIYNYLMESDAIFGFIEHMSILSPTERIEYIGANKDYAPMTVNKSTGEANLNSWATFPVILGNKPYMVKSDGTPDYRLNEDDYTLREDGTASDVANPDYDGGAFSWLPKIYKQEYTLGNDRVVKFCMSKREGFTAVGFIDPDGNELEGVWIPMFYASVVNEKATSISGTQPSHSINTAAQKAALDNFGSRAKFLGGSIWNTLVDLLIMFGKSTNLQEVYGSGNCSGYDSTLAPTYGVFANAVVSGGQFYGTSDGKSLNKIFHSIVLGSYQQWLRDPYTLVVNGEVKVSKNYAYDVTGAAYDVTGITVPNGENVWVYPHKFQTIPEFGSFPVYPYKGTTATGGCDGLYRHASQDTLLVVVLRAGRCGAGVIDGGRALNAYVVASWVYWGIGFALLLLPPVGVAA